MDYIVSVLWGEECAINSASQDTLQDIVHLQTTKPAIMINASIAD